jgi:putative SOS response-associated peptidase YedK
MCGRYVSVQERADLVELYDATAVGEELAPSYNVAPTSDIYAVVEHADPHTENVDRQIRNLRWGLVPSWAKDPTIGNRLINARVETLADKPSWRGPFRHQRAVIPAAGYYEWAPREPDATVRKQPYYLHPIDPNGVLSFASLYEMWRDPSKDNSDPTRWLWTAVIITTDATGPADDIHDRTPLVLPRDRVDAWLDPSRTHPDQIYEILDGLILQPLAVRPVSSRVNRVGTDNPELIKPVSEHIDEPLQLTLTARAA